MNLRPVLSLFAVLLATTSFAQFTTDVYIGVGPSITLNSNSEYTPVLNGNDDLILTPVNQKMTYTAGLAANYTFDSHFLIGGELQYRTSTTEYGFWNTAGDSEYRPTQQVNETEHNIVIPVYAGAHIWNFNFYSGVNANIIAGKTSDFENVSGFVDDGSRFYMGWQAGLGYRYGPFELEARYTQDFKNYASGYKIGSKDMIFYGNRSRWLILVKYNLLHKRA